MRKALLISFLVTLGLCLSFVGQQRQSRRVPQKAVVPPKLAKLYRQPKDKVLEYWDLSHQGLRQVPDLSMYTIKHLNLSHNRIPIYGKVFMETEYKTFSYSTGRLPKGLEVLDISHSKLGIFDISEDSVP